MSAVEIHLYHRQLEVNWESTPSDDSSHLNGRLVILVGRDTNTGYNRRIEINGVQPQRHTTPEI